MTTYSAWLCTQTPERQKASLAHMRVSSRLGELQRERPHSDECRQLQTEIAAYYKKWETSK